MHHDVFISYSRKDTPIADRICEALDRAGISYFIDRKGIAGGMEFPDVLAKAILNCSVFLFLGSANSYQSKFTTNEIIYAFNKLERNQIIPYLIDDTPLPEGLEFSFSAINWRIMSTHPIDTVLIPDIIQRLGIQSSTLTTNDKPAISVAPIIAEKKEPPTYDPSAKIIIRDDLPDGENVLRLYGPGFNGLMGLKKNGTTIIPPTYEYIGSNDQHVAPFESKGNNKTLVAVRKGSKFGYIDALGQEVIAPNYDYAKEFSDGLAAVELGKKWGYINMYGKTRIPFTFDDAYAFHEGLAAVERDGKYGFINTEGELVIPFEFDIVRPDAFVSGYAAVGYEQRKSERSSKTEEQWGIIDRSGKIVTPCEYPWAESTGGGKSKDRPWVNIGRKKYYLDYNHQLTPQNASKK